MYLWSKNIMKKKSMNQVFDVMMNLGIWRATFIIRYMWRQFEEPVKRLICVDTDIITCCMYRNSSDLQSSGVSVNGTTSWAWKKHLKSQLL